jgi:hypothetical protein
VREKAVTGLVVLASLLLVAATLAGYARLAVFDSDRFADRAAAALREPSVRTIVGERLTDQLVLPGEPDLIARGRSSSRRSPASSAAAPSPACSGARCATRTPRSSPATRTR